MRTFCFQKTFSVAREHREMYQMSTPESGPQVPSGPSSNPDNAAQQGAQQRINGIFSSRAAFIAAHGPQIPGAFARNQQGIGSAGAEFRPFENNPQQPAAPTQSAGSGGRRRYTGPEMIVNAPMQPGFAQPMPNMNLPYPTQMFPPNGPYVGPNYPPVQFAPMGPTQQPPRRVNPGAMPQQFNRPNTVPYVAPQQVTPSRPSSPSAPLATPEIAFNYTNPLRTETLTTNVPTPQMLSIDTPNGIVRIPIGNLASNSTVRYAGIAVTSLGGNRYSVNFYQPGTYRNFLFRGFNDRQQMISQVVTVNRLP